MVLPAPNPARLRIIGLIFLCVVIAVVAFTHQLIIPLFLGLLTWGKAFIKNLTPKLTMLFVKNSLVTQIRRLLVQASTHVLVKSHRPWRRWLTETRQFVFARISSLFSRYLSLPLWVRSAIAIAILLMTAGSSFAIFALLIIPQPVLNWLRQKVMATVKKLGIARFFSTIWNVLVPRALRERWHLFVKWTVGRQQVTMAQKLHAKVQQKSVLPTVRLSGKDDADTAGKESL